MLLIFIISFVKIGSDKNQMQINAFFCLIICIIFFSAQFKYPPFITNELNNLNFKANLIMIFSIILGVFSSISENSVIELTLMIILIILNFVFILIFFFSYMIIKIITTKKSKFFLFLGRHSSIIFKM